MINTRAILGLYGGTVWKHLSKYSLFKVLNLVNQLFTFSSADYLSITIVYIVYDLLYVLDAYCVR